MNDDCGDFEGVFDRADAMCVCVLCCILICPRGLHASAALSL